jgi:hypothetical protein
VEWFGYFGPEDTADLFRAVDEIGYTAHHPITGEPIDQTQKVNDVILLPRLS